MFCLTSLTVIIVSHAESNSQIMFKVKASLENNSAAQVLVCRLLMGCSALSNDYTHWNRLLCYTCELYIGSNLKFFTKSL